MKAGVAAHGEKAEGFKRERETGRNKRAETQDNCYATFIYHKNEKTAL